MHSTALLAVLGAASAANAFSFSDITNIIPRFSAPHASPIPNQPHAQPSAVSSAAPSSASSSGSSGSSDTDCSKWTPLVKVFQEKFLTAGQCNEYGRQAIRAAFHDCGTYKASLGTTAGCDGSFVLAKEYTNTENNGLLQIGEYYSELISQDEYKGFGVADMIQLAANVAVVVCPLGPPVTTYMGRPDRDTANPVGLLPTPFQDAETIAAIFEGYGISADLMVALTGAHTTSTQKFVDPARAGAPQDTTDGTWDVKFYGQTLENAHGQDKEIFSFQSDISMSNSSITSGTWKAFVNNQAGWDTAFVEGMVKLALVGVPGGSSQLTDCTSLLPAGTNSKRGFRHAPINARAI